MFSRELKKGSTEMLVLSLLEHRPRHGYEIGKQIEAASGGRLTFRIGSLYPILCRLEDRGLISGRWIERAGERRRRFFRLTADGRKALAEERDRWKQFVDIIDAITRVRHA
jgi:transcriptional regulator